LYETHTHTPLCKHAVGEPEEYAQTAWDRGLKGMLVTCHNPFPDEFADHVRMEPEEFDRYVDMVARARDTWSGRVDVRLGIEADYIPGYEAWLETFLETADFEFVLGSIHPQLPEFDAMYPDASAIEFQRIYFDLLAESAETGLFDCLTHPDIVKIVTPDEWSPELIMDDVCRALDRIAQTNTAMEVNTSGVYKPYPEMNPFPAMLAQMKVRSIPVVIGSDAHVPGRVGELFEDALDLIEAAGYTDASYYVQRQRHDVSIANFRKTLQSASASCRTNF
jgi:histidinol-phosphatase (PHP family)